MTAERARRRIKHTDAVGVLRRKDQETVRSEGSASEFATVGNRGADVEAGEGVIKGEWWV